MPIAPLEIKPRQVIYEHKDGRTKTEFKDDCDVNQILRKFQRGEMIRHLAKGTPQYGDFSAVLSYQDAVEQVRAAEDMFMKLPANIRREFDNDPGALVSFLEDPANTDRAEELGLVKKRAKPAPAEENVPLPMDPVPPVPTGGD